MKIRRLRAEYTPANISNGYHQRMSVSVVACPGFEPTPRPFGAAMDRAAAFGRTITTRPRELRCPPIRKQTPARRFGCFDPPTLTRPHCWIFRYRGKFPGGGGVTDSARRSGPGSSCRCCVGAAARRVRAAIIWWVAASVRGRSAGRPNRIKTRRTPARPVAI
jgi:hypothetical protein